MASSQDDQIKGCPICQNPCKVEVGRFNGPTWAKCPACGEYKATEIFLDDLRNETTRDALLKSRIARWLYETREMGKAFLDSYEGAPPREGFTRKLSLASARNLYPANGSRLEKFEQSLLNLSRLPGKFGQKISWRENRFAFPTLDDEEAYEICKALEERSFIRRTVNDVKADLILTMEGIEYAEKLAHKILPSPKVFIAASFRPEMRTAIESIRKVIGNLGYQPFLVSDPHNELIDLKIYEAIRESAFIIADLTYNRQSVYYEIGFAHGLGLQVVLTCHEDFFHPNESDLSKGVHFDLNHRSIIQWKTEEYLSAKLEGHIFQCFGRFRGKQSD